MCEGKTASGAIQITMGIAPTLALDAPIAIGNFATPRRALGPQSKSK